MSKSVFITGASSGIGKELAKCFASQGYDLILLARRKKHLEELEATLVSKYDISCQCIVQDLREIDTLHSILEGTEIDILVNCAGVAYLGDFTELDWEEEKDMLLVNTMAPILLSKRFAKQYKDFQEEKLLVNIVSTAAVYLHPFLATYSASKVSLLYYSFALEEELRRKNSKLKVFTFCPGPTSTDLFSKEIQERFVKEKKYEMTAESVAQEIFSLLQKKKSFAIIGFRNKILICLLRMLPRKLQLRWVGNFLSREGI